MNALLLSLALLVPPTEGGEVTITSDTLGVTLRCPRPYCDAATEFRTAPHGSALPTKGFSTHVLTFKEDVSLEEAYAQEEKRLSKIYALSYKRLKPGAFAVLSGLSRDKNSETVVYEKLVRGKPGLIGLEVVYAAAQKLELDSAVAKLMKSYSPTMHGGLRLTAEQAQSMVLALPEVERLEKSLGMVRLYVRVEEEPSLQSKPGDKGARYRIFVGEDHPEHVHRVYTFAVDSYTGEIYGYEVLCDYTLPLEKWRQLHARLAADHDGRDDEACGDFEMYTR